MPKIKLTDNQHNYQINKNIYKNIWSYQKKAVTLHPQMRDKAHRKNLTFTENFAEIAQLVEHNLAKVGVAGSSPVFRSSFL